MDSPEDLELHACCPPIRSACPSVGAMPSFLRAVLLLGILGAAGVVLEASAMPDGDFDFFRHCPPRNCSAGGPEVRFPLRLNTSSSFCGAPGLHDVDLRCSGDDVVIHLSPSEAYKVTRIDYTDRQMTIDTGEFLRRCSPQRLFLTNVTDLGPYYFVDSVYTIVKCSEEIATEGDSRCEFRGPIRCLAEAGHFAYAADPYLPMDRLPAACQVVSTGIVAPSVLPLTTVSADSCPRWSRGAELNLSFWQDDCWVCETEGRRCGFNWSDNTTICSRSERKPVRLITGKRKPVRLITGPTLAGVTVLAAALAYLYITAKSSKAKETRLKVERFLATYKTTKPTRYTYGEIKKITGRFQHRLGRGGFGSVYRGELPNGIPVAVKMLEKSMGDGEEFINEVATTGRIHHFNVVRLLGFCSDGPRRALVYEFMPNQSLEKFIFSEEAAKSRRRSLSLEKLEEIAVGIARGIEYLHQGCNERILHFDIKPHNILLDHNLNPKISDFGLAKLCSKDQSIVSMTMARGTLGYIAPEIYSRNFGTVSYKSDVYSFGMLLMEMISGRKTIEPSAETNSQVYLPEKIYDSLVRGEEISSGMEMEGNELIARKLAIVALWCIQWNPSDRPSMTRVVQMLTGSPQSLQIPPTPFVSFRQNESGASPTVNV